MNTSSCHAGEVLSHCSSVKMSIRTYTAIALGVVALCTAVEKATAGAIPPISTLSPSSVKAGEMEIRAGMEYSYHEWGMFQTSDTGRELYRLPDLTLTVGMADNVELVLNYQWLWLNQEGGSMESGTGDLKITGIYRLINETDNRPACALVIATKLPDANYSKGFGTDQTDIWAGGAFSKSFGDLRLLANASIGIIGQPTGDVPNQDDVFVYNIGAIYAVTADLSVGCGLDGIANSRMDNDRTFVRGGIAFKTDLGTFDLGAGTGLSSESGDLHVSAGFSTTVGLWDK